MRRRMKETIRIPTTKGKMQRTKPGPNSSRTKIGSNSRDNSSKNRIRTTSRGRRSNNRDRIRTGNRNSEFSNNSRRSSNNRGRMRVGRSNSAPSNSLLSMIKSSNVFGRAPGKTIAPGIGNQTTAHGNNAVGTMATVFLTTDIAVTSDRNMVFVSMVFPSWSMGDTRASNIRAIG